MTSIKRQSEVLQDRLGLRIAARLNAGATDLPHDITERLRVARQQAVARRKRPHAALVPRPAWALAGAALAGSDGADESPSGWLRLASALPLCALVVGLVTLNALHDDRRAREVAEVDGALLVDDLPPQAYSDPGFTQFLKQSL